MDKINFIVLKLIIFVLSTFLTANSQNYQYGVCSDPYCSDPFAVGITIFKYHSDGGSKLSFVENQEVSIYVEDYGEKKHLIGVMLNGNKGYIPKSFVKETRRFKRDLVPAQIDFIQQHLHVSSYHVTSHLHTSVHPHYTDAHHTVQPSVPNNFNSQPSVQSNQHNNVPLESSREEQGHFHSSSDLYLRNSEVFSDNIHQSDSAHQTSHVHYSSHMHLGFETTIPSQYSGIESPHPQFSSQNQYSYNSQPSFDQGMPNSRDQNFNDYDVLSHDFSVTSVANEQTIDNNKRQFMDVQNNVLPSPTSQQPFPHRVDGEKQNLYTQTDSVIDSQGLQTNTPTHASMGGENNFLSSTPNNNKGSQSYSSSQTSDVENFNLQSSTSLHNTNPEMPSEKQNYNYHSNINQQLHTASPQVTGQSFSGHEEQNFVKNPSIHNQVSQTSSPYETTQNQGFTDHRDFKYVSQESSYNEFDETMAMLESRGLNPEGELTGSFSLKQPSMDSSFQNTNLKHQISSTDQVSASDSIIQPEQSYSEIENNLKLQPDSFSMQNNIFSGEKTETVSLEDLTVKHTDSENLPPSINDLPLSDRELHTTHSPVDIEEIDAEGDDYEDDDVEDEDDFMQDLSKEEQSSQGNNIQQPSKINAENTVESGTESFLEATSIESNVKSSVESNKDQAHINSQSKLKLEKRIQLDESEVIPSNRVHSLIQDSLSNMESSSKEGSPLSKMKISSGNAKENFFMETSKTENLNQLAKDKFDEKQSTAVDTLKESSNDEASNESNSTLFRNKGIMEENVINLVSKKDDFSLLDDKNNNSDTVSESIEDSDNLQNVTDINDTETTLSNAYQTRHLKDIENNNEDNMSPTEEVEQISYTEFNLYSSLQNTFEAVRYFIEALLPWIPDPLYTVIIDLEKDGISPKVPVFTVISAIPCIILMVLLVCIKEKSKEKDLIAQLTTLEKNHYNLIAEKNILEEKLEKTEVELQISRTTLEEEKISSFKLKTEIESLKQQLEETTLDLEKSLDAVDTLKEREREYVELIQDHEKEHLNLLEQKAEVENALAKEETTVANLTEQLHEKEAEVKRLSSENSEYSQANEVYEEKLGQLQKNCNQLLKEAEIWNARVQELNEKLNREVSVRGELQSTISEKDKEIKALSEAIQIFKSFEEVGNDNEEECKSNEEKLQYLINSSSILLKLQDKEEENKFLSERLEEEKTKLLEMEVSILDVKSENDKLKINYNQALQDKAEAQTKLEVLTNYFKDKEIQLQRQLGVQEAVRQKTEEDASSAERRICLIEQENTSYKYQVATMKQEMEETERNLKNQIAVQEKKAHENWLAARTAERKLEDVKQEVMQLRQRLTLLEREQENWNNSNREEIVRPVPKRLNNDNDNAVSSQDINSSMELRPNIFPPPPMMLPHDRPLPPLPPPLPPFPPFEPPPFRPQPWHMPPLDSLSNSDYRITPPEFTRGRESTPPRGRNSAVNDGDMGPRQSSPLGDMRDSRNSTPPHFLPDFHDIPPPPRPFFPPMGPHPRYPLPPPPPFRKEMGHGQRRIDNQDESTSSYGSQRPSVPQDNWHNPNSRV